MRERAARSVQVTLDELQRSSIITPEERSILLGLDDLSPKNLVAVGMAVASVAAAAKNRPAEPDALATFLGAAKQLQESLVEARVPFCWVDGPLVHAMKNGDIMLIDELNLADDSVLERLNRQVTVGFLGGQEGPENLHER